MAVTVPATVVVAVTDTPVADALPAAAVFRTFATSVTTWPELTEAGGWAWKVTVSMARARTVVAGVVVAAAVRSAPEFAASPLAVAVKVTVPEPVGVQEKVNGTVVAGAMVVVAEVAAVQVAATDPYPWPWA